MGNTMGCCAGCGNKSRVVIEFLYLDLDTCDRCIGTQAVLEEAVADMRQAFGNVAFELRKIQIDTKEKAEAYRLLTSPTIRIDGQDVDSQIKETCCEACGEICGSDVDCRVWTYGGETYTVPPKALLTGVLRQSVCGTQKPAHPQEPYALPENLRRFFDGPGNGEA